MKTFILLHGAYQGGWIWSELATQLREHHYNVHTPTFTGMGDKAHLLTEHITLQTHIDDVINLIHYEDLSDIVLVGYSYSGLIIPAVYEVFPKQISQLIFIDSFIPQHSRSGLDIIPIQDQDRWQRIAQAFGHGWKLPASEKILDGWGIDDAETRKFLLPKITDFSLNFMKTPIFLSEHFEKATKSYIRCIKPSYMSDLMLPFYHHAKAYNWPTYEIPTGHVPMVTMHDELLHTLIQAISATKS